MDAKVIIILCLVGLSFFQYAYPDKSQSLLEPIYGKASDWVSSKMSWNTKVVPTTSKCPDVNEPVCGNGVTYKNTCEAALQDVLQVTPGAC